MVRRLTTSVASSGTRSVERNTTNRMPRPGKSSIANAYADITEVTAWNSVTTTATTSELTRYRPSRPSVHAWRRISRVNESGTSGFWSTFSPGLSDATIVVYTGNSTTNVTVQSSA